VDQKGLDTRDECYRVALIMGFVGSSLLSRYGPGSRGLGISRNVVV
jgi:hypothetical protein